MTAWWYWLLFALAAALLLLAVPYAARWEQERDREEWRRMGGGRL